MPYELSALDREKNEIIYSLFVDTADQNYIVARWCFQKSLHLDFFWNGAHALEKYIKSALLFNGHSSIRSSAGREYRHDLALLFTDLQSLAGNLLPETLVQPRRTRIRNWKDESISAFIQRLCDEGDPNNRYATFGYIQQKEDLYKFDQTVFALRRICCPLNAYAWGAPSFGEVSFRDELAHNPKFMPDFTGSRFDQLTKIGADKELRHAALNHNLMFAEENYEHGTLRTANAISNSVLEQALSAAERSAIGEEKANATQLLDWIVENIFLPSGFGGRFKESLSRLRSSQ